MSKRLSTIAIMHKLIALLLIALVCPMMLLLLARLVGWRIQIWMILLPSAVLVVGAIRMSILLRERLRAQAYAFETMPDGLILINDRLQADYVNPVAGRSCSSADWDRIAMPPLPSCSCNMRTCWSCGRTGCMASLGYWSEAGIWKSS